jgi:vacuolar-type H+-ATPase subunit E/Vma4
MSLQDILQKILDEAKIEIDLIKKDLEKEKAILLEESTKIEAENKLFLAKKQETTGEKIKQKTDSMARREVRQKMLATRHKIVVQAMNSFAEHLEKLSDDKYGEILKKLFSNISEDNGLILTSTNRLEITRKLAPKGFSVEVDNSIQSGFIAKLEKSEIDNTFQNLIFSEFHNQIRGFFAEKLSLI